MGGLGYVYLVNDNCNIIIVFFRSARLGMRLGEANSCFQDKAACTRL